MEDEELSSIRKAVILCAGAGTRLRPFTERCPKVMLPLNEKPLLERHIEWLKRYGISEVYINLHYLPQAITSYFGDGSRFEVRIIYSFERKLRGTAGALNGFRDHLDETFLLHYGDVYSELDVLKMLRFHRRMNATATLAVHSTNHPHDSDIVALDEHSRVSSVHHKPVSSNHGSLGNAACYILEPRVLRYIPDQEAEIDFIQGVFPRMISSRESLYGYCADELLYDMGTLDRYETLKRGLESR